MLLWLAAEGRIDLGLPDLAPAVLAAAGAALLTSGLRREDRDEPPANMAAVTARTRTRTATRIRRDPSDRVVAGVCAALAKELGIDPVILRVAFIGAALAGVSASRCTSSPGCSSPRPVVRRRTARHLPAAAPARGGSRRAWGCWCWRCWVRRLGLPFSDTVVWPVVSASAGAGLIWYRSATSRPRRRGPAPSRTRGFPVTPGRLALGAVLVAGAVTAFLVTTGFVTTLREGLLWGAALVAALALVVTPLLWRLAASWGGRAERIRTQERAEVAARTCTTRCCRPSP